MKVGRPTFVPAKDTFCTRNFPKTIDWILVKLTNILPVRKHSRWLIVYSSQGLRSNKPRSYPNQLLSRSHPNYSPYQPVASWHTTKLKSLDLCQRQEGDVPRKCQIHNYLQGKSKTSFLEVCCGSQIGS